MRSQIKDNISAAVLPGSFTDPSAEGLSRERARERDRSRPHERRHHSSAGEKQRYYSCERYGSREQCHAKSAGPSRSTSPGEGPDTVFLKQVSYMLKTKTEHKKTKQKQRRTSRKWSWNSTPGSECTDTARSIHLHHCSKVSWVSLTTGGQK